MGNQAPGQTPNSFGGGVSQPRFGASALPPPAGINSAPGMTQDYRVGRDGGPGTMQSFLSNALQQVTNANANWTARNPSVNNLVGGVGNVLGMRTAALQGGAGAPNISDMVRGVGQNMGMQRSIMSGGGAPNAPLGQGGRSK